MSMKINLFCLSNWWYLLIKILEKDTIKNLSKFFNSIGLSFFCNL